MLIQTRKQSYRRLLASISVGKRAFFDDQDGKRKEVYWASLAGLRTSGHKTERNAILTIVNHAIRLQPNI